MANSSLTSLPLSSNDMTSLTQIFSISLQYYCKHTSPLEKDYLKKLRTAMGLGFTTILVDGSLITIYKPHLEAFLSSSHSQLNITAIQNLSSSVANMISGAAYLFRFTDHPQYYESFVNAVKNTVTHITVQKAGKIEEAKRLLQILFQKHHSLF